MSDSDDLSVYTVSYGLAGCGIQCGRGIRHLSLPALIPVLTKAIQEQQEQIDYSLKKDIDSLKTEMTALKKANERLIQAGAMLSEENELMRNQIKQIMALLAGSF